MALPTDPWIGRTLRRGVGLSSVDTVGCVGGAFDLLEE